MKKATAFFKENNALFFAPLIVCAVYLFMLMQYKVYPFGTQYTVADYDLSGQISPFVEHVFDAFKGKTALLYSHAILGGMDVTGTLLYFILSPFSFLFFIFGEGRVVHAAGIVLVCKLAAVSVAGTWFAKKLFKGIPDYLCIAIGVVYTFCGYTFVSNTYINWVDFLIYMPFAAGAFRHFVKTDKFLPFAILMACCIYTCFSIACFSMFTVFPALIVYALFCIEKSRRNMFIAKLCLSFAVAVLLALPVLLPALSIYMAAARGGQGGIFANLWKGFVDYDAINPMDMQAKEYIKDFASSIYSKWTYILADSIFLLLTLIWFYKTEFKKPFAKFMLLAGIMTLLPTVIDEVMVIMNMGSYMSYSLRFGFLNALYFLGGACLCLERVCFQKNCAFDGGALSAIKNSKKMRSKNLALDTEKHSVKKQNEGGMYALNEKNTSKLCLKNRNICNFVIIGLGLLATAFLYVFIMDNNYKDDTLWGIFLKDSDNLKGLSNFSKAFAHSLGGLPVIMVLFVAVIIVAIVGSILVEKRKISPRLLSYVLLVVVGMQVLFYSQQLVVGNLSTLHKTTDTYTRLCAQIKENDESYFRVKDYKAKLSTNVALSSNTNTFAAFSSMIDKDNFATYPLFGYLGNGKNSYKSAHDTTRKYRCEEFGDSFLGYKYYFVPKGELGDFEEGMKPAKYVKPYMVTNAQGEKEHLCENGYYIYQNEIVFPSAYLLPNGAFRFKKPNELNTVYRKYNQQALYEFLRGKTLAEMQEVTGSTSDSVVTPETARELSEYLWQRAVDIKVESNKITACVEKATEGETLFLNFVASKGYTVSINGESAKLIDNDLKFLSVALREGKNEVVFSYQSPYVKYMAVGGGVALIGLLVLAFIIKKTKWLERLAPVIAWTGILLGVAVVALFMLYPSVACLIKWIKII